MKIQKSLPAIMAALLALLVVAAGLLGPRALFAATDNALYTTHAAERTGGSLAIQPEDLPLVRTLRAQENHIVNGGYWNSYENTWETVEDVARRIRELSGPLLVALHADTQKTDAFWEDIINYGMDTSHNITAIGCENIGVYGRELNTYRGAYVQAEMETGLLISFEFSARPQDLPFAAHAEKLVYTYKEYLGLSMFTDWTLLSTEDAQRREGSSEVSYTECLLYSAESSLAIYSRHMDFRPQNYGEAGRQMINLWIESIALNPGRPGQWQEEYGIVDTSTPPPATSGPSSQPL